MDSFCENRKSRKTAVFWPFLGGLFLAMILTSQSYDFDAIAHIGLWHGVHGVE